MANSDESGGWNVEKKTLQLRKIIKNIVKKEIGEMKGKVKFLIPIILAIVVMAVTLGVYLFPRVEEIVDSAKAGETMLADKTGNTSEFGLAGVLLYLPKLLIRLKV